MTMQPIQRAVSAFSSRRATGTDNHGAMNPLTHDELRHYAPSIFAPVAHESRSQRYAYIPTLAIVEALEARGFLPFSAKQAKARDEGKRDYTKHMVRFRHPDAAGQGYRGGANGEAIPEVVLVNSHDGSSSYQLFGGMFRALCLNGLILADGYVETVKIGHKGKPEIEVVEGSFRVLEQVGRASQAIEDWQGINLTPQEAQLFAGQAHALRFGQPEYVGTELVPASVIPVDRMLQARRFEDKRDDLWHVFNRVQENAMRGGLTGHTKAGYVHDQDKGRDVYKPSRRVTSKEVRGIDQDVKLNKALWALADGMAKLKAAA